MSYTLHPLKTQRLQRSELAVPGSNPSMIDKAAESEVDYIFLDLEDAVAPPDKVQARANIIQALNDIDWKARGKTMSIRINGLDTHYMYRDVVEIVEKAGQHLDTILVPKVGVPADLYMVEGLSAFAGQGHELRLVDTPEDVAQAIDESVAVVMLTHVNYRTGRVHDMADITKRAHQAGALVVWDLAHSTGALPVDLAGADADFAVGCTYKYLNGGPGAPAFVYVAPRLQTIAVQPLSGWFGHSRPFAFDPSFEPAETIHRFLTGTPPVLSMTALEPALAIWDRVDIAAVRAKSVRLCEYFIALVEEECAGFGLELASPRDSAQRGSQVSFRHENAFAVMQALISRDVVGDFRAPDIMRFGFAPLYIRFVDVFDAVAMLSDILRSEAWRDDRFQVRSAVT